MDISASAYPAIGAVAAAIIAGGISFVVTVLAKDQKTSEFRQAWIDALRDDLADFVSTVDTLSSFLRLKVSSGQSSGDLVVFFEQKVADVHRMGVSYNRILLRLNPDEHGNLAAHLKALLSVMSSYEKASDDKHVDRLTREVVEEAQKILKTEWRRVKRGEPVFRLTKYAALTFFVLGIAVAVAVAWGHLIISWHA